MYDWERKEKGMEEPHDVIRSAQPEYIRTFAFAVPITAFGGEGVRQTWIRNKGRDLQTLAPINVLAMSQPCSLSLYNVISFVGEHAHDQKTHIIILCIYTTKAPRAPSHWIAVSKISSAHSSHRILSSSRCLLCPLAQRSATSSSFPLGLSASPSHSLPISLNISYEVPFHYLQN